MDQHTPNLEITNEVSVSLVVLIATCHKTRLRDINILHTRYHKSVENFLSVVEEKKVVPE